MHFLGNILKWHNESVNVSALGRKFTTTIIFTQHIYRYLIIPYCVDVAQPAVCSCIDPLLHSTVCMLTFPLTLVPSLPHGCLLCCMHQPPTLTQPLSYHLLGSSHPWYVNLLLFWRWTVAIMIVACNGVVLWLCDACRSIWMNMWPRLRSNVFSNVFLSCRDSPEETGGRAWKNDRAGGSVIWHSDITVGNGNSWINCSLSGKFKSEAK